MYIRQTNPVALRSQQMILEAVNALMREKHFRNITVTEICRIAGVGRKTFYRNFELKEDVIDLYLDHLYEAYTMEMERLEPGAYLEHHFSFLERHKEQLIVLYRNDLLPVLAEKFSQILPKAMPRWSWDPVEQKYRSAYIASGIEAVVRVWADMGFQQSAAELAAIAYRAQEKQVPVE